MTEVTALDLLQIWLVVGVPAIVVVAGLFAGTSRRRALVGYVLLAALVVVFALTPGGASSAALVGLAGAGLVAVGRGTDVDAARREHHQDRRRFTTAARG